MPESQTKALAKQRFLLRLAALYASEAGTVSTLASLIEINHSTLKSQAVGVCRASTNTWKGIEKLLGKGFIPIEIDQRNLRDSL